MLFSTSPSGKRKILTATLLSTLLCTTLAGALLVNLVAANAAPVAPPLIVTVQLPENKVYAENSIPVAFTVETVSSGIKEFMCTYVLDYKGAVFLSQVIVSSRLYSYNTTLLGLSEGKHSLKVSVSGSYYYGFAGGYRLPFGGGDEVFFTVNAAEPRVRVLSPKPAKTYNATTLPLNFTVSEPANWLGYSLDGEAPVTVTGNTPLSGLSDGTHTIVVQAEDTAGSTGESTPITFKVETQQAAQPTEPQPTPFPTTLVATSVITVAVVGLGLLGYFKKRKR